MNERELRRIKQDLRQLQADKDRLTKVIDQRIERAQTALKRLQSEADKESQFNANT